MTAIEVPALFAVKKTVPVTTVTAVRITRTSALVRGSTEVITDALITTGKAFKWSRPDSGYVVPLAVLDAVLIAIENAGHRVSWRDGLW